MSLLDLVVSSTDDAQPSVSNSVNDHFANMIESDDDIQHILDHQWNNGMLEILVEYYTGVKEFHPFEYVKDDEPRMVAEYVTDSSHLPDSKMVRKYGRWARHLLRKLRKTVRRLSKIYGNYVDPPSHDKPKGRKKPGPNKRKKNQFKNGNEIPNPDDYDRAVELDVAQEKTYWQTAVRDELAALIHHKCFSFKPGNYKPSKDFQHAPLVVIFELKQDLRRKAHLVIQGCRVDPRNLLTSYCG